MVSHMAILTNQDIAFMMGTTCSVNNTMQWTRDVVTYARYAPDGQDT